MNKSSDFNIISLAIIIIGSTLLFSCKTKEDIIRKRPLGNRTTQFLVDQLKKNEFDFQWLSLKASTEANIDGDISSFRAFIRVRKDSALWMSISPVVGMEVARMIITPDSVKFMNRMEKSFFEGDFDLIHRMLNIDADYETLQSLIVGNSIGIVDEDDKLKSSVDNDHYLISTFRKRRLRKQIEKSKLDEILHSVWIEPDSFKVTKLSIHDLKLDKALTADYNDFTTVDNQLFPKKAVLSVVGGKPARIEISHSRINTGEPLKMPFKVPEKYEQIY